MEDPTTIALNLTFLGTLGVAFVMFLGLFAGFVATLVLAGAGRLIAVVVMAIARGLTRIAGWRIAAAWPTADAAAPRASAARKEAPHLSSEWAAAVARADARAAARAKAATAPAIKVSVRDLPSATAPAQDITKVAPLVESATDRNGELNAIPRAFKKPPMRPAPSLLDTGSLVSVRGRPPLGPDKHRTPAQERKAG